MEIQCESVCVKSAGDIASIILPILRSECEVDRGKEHFWVIGRRIDGVVQYVELVSLGVLDQCSIHPREVFRFAIMKGVHSIILVHNHPSSTVSPSKEDESITQQLVQSGEILGIKVLDHVIVGGTGGYYSIMHKEKGEV